MKNNNCPTNKKYCVEFITPIEVEADSVYAAKKKAYHELLMGSPGCCAVYELDEYNKSIDMGLRQKVTIEHDRPAIRNLSKLTKTNISDDVSLDYAINGSIEIIEVLANELGLTLDDITNWSNAYCMMHTKYLEEKER